MKFRKVFIILTAIAAVVLFSYFHPEGIRSHSPLGSKASGYSDPSKMIRTEVGEEFSIELESNPTTGYGWSLSKEFDDRRLKVVEIRHHAAKTSRVGAGGRDLWVFEALRPGQVVLSLEYVRPWEKDIPPVQRKDFTVLIKESGPN